MPPRAARGVGNSAERSSRNRLPRIATNENALIVNSQPVPNGPTRIAAIAGPKMRDPVIVAVLSEIALAMSSSGTSSVTNPRRAGLSNALTTPSTNVST